MQVCCCGSSPLSQSLQPLPCNCAAIAPVIAAFAPGSPATCVPVTAARRRRRSGATSRNRRNQPPQAGQQRLGSAAISCNGHNQPPQAPWPRWERHSSDSDERPGLRLRRLGYGRLGWERPGLSRLRRDGANVRVGKPALFQCCRVAQACHIQGWKRRPLHPRRLRPSPLDPRTISVLGRDGLNLGCVRSQRPLCLPFREVRRWARDRMAGI